ncbi:tetratricopeptide repeat protein [Pseudovibrio ascidiaceicola]|uniref:tetratricopeptide repeat protein n=1 Tax=Pseudovibrio ascidiaceicola TaxID=285279 RepID=UPI003D361056
MISRAFFAFLLTGVFSCSVQEVSAASVVELGRSGRIQEVLEENAFPRSILEEHRTRVEIIDFDALRLQAEQGDADAQYQLGRAFWAGEGVALNYEKAFYWLTKANEQEHVDARVPLATMYERGYHVFADYKRAAELYFEASQQGDDWALAQLATMYISGEGVKKDVNYGLKLLHQLADLEHYAALVYLGDYAEEGLEGIAPDYEQAAEYFERARDAGSNIAASRLADMIYAGRLGDVDMERVFALLEEDLSYHSLNAAISLAEIYLDGTEVPKDVAKALEYFELAAEWGSSYALVEIGEIYEDGALGPVDYEKAEEYYQIARKRSNGNGSAFLAYLKRFLVSEEVDSSEVIALLEESIARGSYSGMVGLGDCYRDGYGVEVDYHKANDYYEMAAEAGSSLALVRLGNAFDEGLGVEKDFAKAIRYYQDAVDGGYQRANADLGFLYEQGLGTEKDHEKANELYEKGHKAGSAFGAYRLGLIYYYGDGAEQDYPTSLKMFHKAADRGNEGAYSYLGYQYHYALGVAADPFEARYWYEDALALGIDDVKIDLAFLEEDGLGGPRNLQRAKQLYRESSSENPEALYHLARLKAEADPANLRLTEHVLAYRAAMEKGSDAAKLELANIYMFTNGKLRDVARAKQFLEELVETGYSDAYVYLGAYYDEVILNQKNAVKESVVWFEKAAALGNTYAAQRLAWIYKHSPPDGYREDNFQRWNQKLGLGGDASAAYSAAYYLEFSRLEQDMKLQEQLYNISANAGDLDAQLKLAKKYIFGSKYTSDYEGGVGLLRKAVRTHGGAQAYRVTKSLSGGLSLQDMLKAKKGYNRDWDHKVLTAINLFHGLTVPKNAKIAEKLIRSEPDRWEFSPEARYTLAAIIFEKASPSATELAEALQALTITANAGYASGQKRLAELYEQGQHVEQDYRRAAMWYRIASAKVPSLKVQVARLILEGKVEPNYGEDALQVLTDAAEQLDRQAIDLLVDYWAMQQPDGYEHTRWVRRQIQMNEQSS